MKKIIILAAMLCTSAAYAGKKNNSLATALAGLKPYQATVDNVKEILGEPDKVDKNTKQMIWYYNKEGEMLSISWDMELMRLTKYYYKATEEPMTEWDVNNGKYLLTDKSTVADVLKSLGQPKQMVVELNQQYMLYEYNHNMLHLRFLNDKLYSYDVRGMGKADKK